MMCHIALSLIAMMAFFHLGSAVLSQGEACRRCKAGCVPLEVDCRHERCPEIGFGPATPDCQHHCARHPAVRGCLNDCTMCAEISESPYDSCTRCLYPCASAEIRCQSSCGSNGSDCRAQCAVDPEVVSCRDACSSSCQD